MTIPQAERIVEQFATVAKLRSGTWRAWFTGRDGRIWDGLRAYGDTRPRAVNAAAVAYMQRRAALKHAAETGEA